MNTSPKHVTTKKNKRNWIVLICLLSLFVGTVGGTYAFLVSQDRSPTNTFNGGQVTASVVESFDKTTKSNVTVKNTGNVPAYMRATYVVSWVDANGNVYHQSPKEGTDYTVSLGNQWTKQADGYYYTNSAVAAGAQSAVLINQLKAVSGKAPSGYHLEVNVIAHALQQAGDAKDAVWQPVAQPAPTLPDFEGGMTFAADKLYKASSGYNRPVLTFEAVVKIPANPTTRSGVILGNYGGTEPMVSFEIGNNTTAGVPRVFYQINGQGTDYLFSKSVIADNEWHHIAICLDTTHMRRYCYLDGAAFDNQLITDADVANISQIAGSTFWLGGDGRGTNDQYFKGSIRSVAIFFDVRSHAEGRQDASRMFNAEKLSNEHALLGYWDCLNGTDSQIPDLSSNKNHMIRQ